MSYLADNVTSSDEAFSLHSFADQCQGKKAGRPTYPLTR